jgi:hypothetical protein
MDANQRLIAQRPLATRMCNRIETKSKPLVRGPCVSQLFILAKSTGENSAIVQLHHHRNRIPKRSVQSVGQRIRSRRPT